MDLARIARHLLVLPGAAKRALPSPAMAAIEQAIARSETQHSGEVRFAAEPALDTAALLAGQSARERAIEVFSVLRLWDTEERNGVLIYLLMADRDIEIVADRGVSAKVVAAEWEAICREMETALRRGEYGEAVVAGIEAASRLLARHFPRGAGDRNELPDRPVTL
ncbi:MAG TPA: TPM domain-containing protein [Burkholderiales bacterium]|nr:TPM domain-containing protein [Burkholderiales bacterium]